MGKWEVASVKKIEDPWQVVSVEKMENQWTPVAVEPYDPMAANPGAPTGDPMLENINPDRPILVEALDFLTGHFPELRDTPEVQREGDRLKFNVPQSAEVPLLQSPEMALSAGATRAIKTAAPIARRLYEGGKEALSWATGNLSDVPAITVKGTRGAAKKIWEVADIKPLEDVAETVIKATPEPKATEAVVAEPKSNVVELVKPEPVQPEAMQPQSGKVTKAASDINRSMVEAGMNELPAEDLARYTPITKAGQVEKITKLMDSDYEKVKNMAIGREPIPEDVTPQALYNAVKKKAYADGDTETLRKLASSPVATERSLAAQKLGAAGWDNSLTDDPVKAMQDISKSRAEDIEKRTGKKPVADAKVTELETKLADAEKKIAEYESKQKVKGFDASLKDKAPRGAYGSRNKLVTKSDYDTAKAALKERLSTQLSSGIDPANLADMTKIGMYHLEAGARDFAVWSKSIIDDVGKWAEPHLKGLYDQTIKAFHEAGVTKYSGKIGELVKDGKELSEVGNQVNELARHFVALGVKNRDELVTKVHEVLKQSMPDITRMETTHAIAGYGKFRPLSKDDISVKLRGYKGELQQVSKMEDILNKRPPLKTGVERRIPTDEERRLIQQVNELKKKYGITTTDKETQLKSALDSIKTRLNNQIKDLEAQISTKTKIVKEKTAPPTDKETEALKAKRDALKKQYDEIFAKPKKTVTDIKEAALKKRLEKQIEVLNKQITTREKATRQKYSTVPDKDTSALMDKVADLRKQRDAIFGGKTEQQKIAQAMAAVQKSISQYEKRIKSQDFSSLRKKGAQTTSPELDALRAERDALKEQFEHLKDLAKPKLTPEQIALKSLKRKMENETKKLTEKIEKGDFTKTKRETILDAEGLKLKNERDRIKDAYNAVAKGSGTVTKEEAQTLLDLSKDMKAKREAMEQGGNRLEYGASRVAYERYIEQLKGANAPIKERLANRAQEFGTTFKTDKGLAVKDLLLDSLKTLTENSIAMVATLDNSFLGRQGLKVLMTHPTAWWSGAKNSFIDIYKTMKGQKAMDALWADVYSRKNFLNGNYEKAKIITKTEEQYPTSLPSKIPYIGRVFKASETAFEGSAMRMRTDLFDLISEKATANGVNMADKTQLESVGKLINSLTARGQWGKKGEGTFVRMILWAPKMLKANIDVLTAHAGQGMSPFARKEAAMNLVKLVGETALVLGAANALKPGSVEFDSRSTDFGKIKVGDTRFDITGGMASIVTLASRLITNSSKSASTGIIQDYGPGIAERSRFDALLDFLTNKTSPPASVVRDFLKGTDWKGAEFTTGGAVFQAFTPISLQKSIELKDDASADRVAGAIADVFGMGAQSFGASEATWRASQSKQMEAFHKQVGDANFKKANKEFNDTFNAWFEKSLKNDSKWKQATDEDKQQFLARQKEGLRNSIMGKYWIKGKQ